MTSQINLSTQHPDAYKALIALSAAAEQGAEQAGLDPLLVELVKLRTSQINGCGFCLRLHTRDAVRKGETSDRLAVLPAWRETAYFSEAERAALAVAESVTLITSEAPASDGPGSFEGALTIEQLSAVAWLATVMNAFNRVARMSGYSVEPDEH